MYNHPVAGLGAEMKHDLDALHHIVELTGAGRVDLPVIKGLTAPRPGGKSR